MSGILDDGGDPSLAFPLRMKKNGIMPARFGILFKRLPAVLLTLMIASLHAESEGLVKSEAITNTLISFGTAAEHLAAGDTLVSSGDTEKAIATYRFIAKTYPKSKEAPEAQFKLAKQLNKKGNFESAFKEYETLLKKYPQTPNFEESVADQINIANAFLKGMKVKFLGIPMTPSLEKAEEMYTAILKVSPYSKHAAITQFNLGLALQKQGKAQEAIAAYQRVLDKYPNSAACDSAAYQVGYVYQLLGMTGKSQDLSALKQAGQNMKKMFSKESADTLRVARFYDLNKEFKASSIYYNDVIRRFPQSEEATAAKSRLDELKALYGEDTLRVGQERPENGERLAERRRLQAQVESTALANYDGPPKKDVVPEEAPARQPKMKGDLRDTQPIPLQEPPAQTPAQKTPLAP